MPIAAKAGFLAFSVQKRLLYGFSRIKVQKTFSYENIYSHMKIKDGTFPAFFHVLGFRVPGVMPKAALCLLLLAK